MDEILKNYTVLFADDEKVIRDNFSNFLSSYFHTVFLASDGEEALMIYKKESPDVIILDINMPQIDGLEVAKIIRETNNNTPIVMLTAHTEKDRLFKAIELNLTKYIVKPINRKQSREILDILSNKLSKIEQNIILLDNGLSWDQQKKTLYDQNKEEIKLRTKEREFFDFMVIKKDKEVSFLEIFTHIWPDELPEYNMANRIKTIAKDLRKKVPENTLKSIYGFGFKL